MSSNKMLTDLDLDLKEKSPHWSGGDISVNV